MEEWQETHITKNLPKLISLTDFNCQIQAELLANNILCRADIDILDAQRNQHGKLQACKLYNEMLMGRTNSYKILTQALLQYNQTGAAKILIRVPNELFSKPLTYLGISVTVQDFQDVHIQVNGKTIKIQEFFFVVDYAKLQSIFQESISELEFYDTFVIKEKTFVLASNTIPPKPSFYVPRFLSNRNKLNKSIFKADCSDVFVFKKSIARYKLSQLAMPNFTASSKSQLVRITSRFIYLDENEDWIDMKKLAKAPIHLIRYEADQEIFLLEDTSEVSDILRKFVSKTECVNFSEDDFVKQQLSEDFKDRASSVCICDTPGMGKTFLSANLARRMVLKSTGRIIVFMPLITFISDISKNFPSNSSTQETALLTVLKYTSSSQEHLDLLHQLVKTNLLSLEIFFDGFDEITEIPIECTIELFHLIITKLPKVKIFITSRPHMRQELEEGLGVLAYDILPFNHQNQIDFLVQFWSQQVSNIDEKSLQNYATSCLEAVSKSLTENEKEITGVPLLCQLIGEIYANQVALKRMHLGDVPLKVSQMYQKFIELRFNLVANNKKEFDSIKLVHIWHALDLFSLAHFFHKDDRSKIVNHSRMSSDILKVGILQHSNRSLEFIHRTFAEYLVADYVTTKLQTKETKSSGEMSSSPIFMLKFFFLSTKHFFSPLFKRKTLYFLHPVIVSFLDSALSDSVDSENVKSNFALYLSSMSPDNLDMVLCACCQDNFYNIFSLLKDAMKKSDINWIRPHLYYASLTILIICIRYSTSEMLHGCIELFTDVSQPNLRNLYELLPVAIEHANYEAVEYLVDMVPLKREHILGELVRESYLHDLDTVKRRENILQLLLNKDSSLTNELPKNLGYSNIHMRLIKVLVEFGVKLTVDLTDDGESVLTSAAYYMSPIDFHELITFVCTDCKSELSLHKNDDWIETFSAIVERVTLLPETMDLLLKFTGVDINMLSDSLYFAVQGNKLENLQQLMSRGLEHKARLGENPRLVHAAVEYADEKMVQYLLSLKLDPNSCDDDGDTPLHYAVKRCRSLPVIEILVEHGTNVKAKNLKRQTALHLFSADTDFQPEVIKYLIENGLGVNDRDIDGNTPLHLCKKKRIKNFLVEMGADINARNNKGETSVELKRDK